MSLDLAKRPLIAYIAFSVSTVFHLLAFLVYSFRWNAGPSLSPIDVQVYIMGALLLMGVPLCLLIRTLIAFRAAMLVRAVLVVFLCIGYRQWFTIRLLLVAALSFEIGIYERFPVNLYTQVALILASFFVLEMSWAIRSGWSEATAIQAAQFVLIPATIGVPAAFITRYRERMLDEHSAATRLSQTVSQLSRSNVLLQDAAFRAEEQSKAFERHRVAREIHDTVGYSMTNLIMMMEAATDLVFEQPEELQRMMQAARDRAKSGLEETRRALRELRAYEEPSLVGLKAIDKLVSTYDHVNWLNVDVEYGNAPMTFGEEVDLVLFHFIQEGLTNALRHGKATSIVIRFWLTNANLRVLIRDNGVGAQTIHEGIGLAGMKERIFRLGGSVEAKDVEDGFQVALVVPLEGRDSGENTRAFS